VKLKPLYDQGNGKESDMPEEHEIYSSEGVRVTNLRARIGDRIFSVSKITSVSMSEEQPSRAAPLLLFGVGIASLVWFASSIRYAPALTMNYVALLLGILCFAGGFFVGRGQKTSYSVNIESASGERDALYGHDKAQVQEVVQALQEAIIEQG
jgi:hypothetical protein